MSIGSNRLKIEVSKECAEETDIERERLKVEWGNLFKKYMVLQYPTCLGCKTVLKLNFTLSIGERFQYFISDVFYARTILFVQILPIYLSIDRSIILLFIFLSTHPSFYLSISRPLFFYQFLCTYIYIYTNVCRSSKM